jgi:hypothetical protein
MTPNAAHSDPLSKDLSVLRQHCDSHSRTLVKSRTILLSSRADSCLAQSRLGRRGEFGGVTMYQRRWPQQWSSIDTAHGAALLTSAVKLIPVNGVVNRECDKGEHNTRTYNCFLSVSKTLSYIVQKCRYFERVAEVERQNIATSVHSKERENIRSVIDHCDEEQQHKCLHVSIHKATEGVAHTHVWI